MVGRIKTVSFKGVEVLDIDVEVQISSGFVAFTNVGYIIRRFKPLFLLMIITGLFSPGTSMASGETLLKCAEDTSRIISVCDDQKLAACSSQKWKISGRTIDLKNSQATGFHVHEWACLPSKQGYKIILYSINWGNCDTCERLSIWDLKGQRIADWKEFESAYKKLNFPNVAGQEFHDQFNEIKLRD